MQVEKKGFTEGKDSLWVSETARNCRVMQVTNTGQDCGLQVKKEKRVVRSEGERKSIPMTKE